LLSGGATAASSAVPGSGGKLRCISQLSSVQIKPRGLTPKAKLELLFQVLDSDQCGSVPKALFGEVFGRDAEPVFGKLDKNNDGMLQQSEWNQYIDQLLVIERLVPVG